MNDSEIIEAHDINGTVIEIGTHVKYINTDTIGIVTDIKRDSDGEWALIDKTDLYYNAIALEVTNAEIKEEVGEHVASTVDAEKYLKDRADVMNTQELDDLGAATGGG